MYLLSEEPYMPYRRRKRRTLMRDFDYFIENYDKMKKWIKDQEKDKEDKDNKKKSGNSAASLAMLMIVCSPIVGPLYLLVIMHVLASITEIAKTLH